MREINGDGDRLGWHIISMGLWIDVQFVCGLLESLDRLSGAARGHILDAAYRSLLIFLPLPPIFPSSIHSLSSPSLAYRLFFFFPALPLARRLHDFMSFITPLVIVMTLFGIMF